MGIDDMFGPPGTCGLGITFDKSSDNPFLVPPDAIHVDHILNMNGRTFQVTATPVFPLLGRAVITITAIDPDCNRTSTSFVLDVINNGNTQPSITGTDGTWIEQDVTQNPPYIFYHFQVADSETPKNQLLVTATASNAKLVPNDATHLTVSSISNTGTGTLKITPVLPLPSPSPGVPQAATITLSVTDDVYTRRMQFLYVAKNPNSAALSFSRPTGVYNLDPGTTQHRRDDAFLTGEMRRISWNCIDNGGLPATWDWSSLNQAFSDVPQPQGLSLNLIEEPCYIAAHEIGSGLTWCDTSQGGNPTPHCSPAPTPCTTCTDQGKTGILRVLPWDTYLQQQRAIFLRELAAHPLPNGTPVAKELRIPIINPNLPGGDTGIRELNGNPFIQNTPTPPATSPTPLPGYTRAALLKAVRTELLAVQANFSTKLIHIGFFTVEDDQDANNGNESLWHYLYSQLASQLTNEFNGTRRPRVHFFQEDLAAKRASAAPDYIPYLAPPNNTTAYSFTPAHCQLPSFAFTCGNTGQCDPLSICPPTDLEYNNGITYQANTAWSGPLGLDVNGEKVSKTLNGTPNDAMEAAFNSYLNEYVEVYPDDLDHAQLPTATPSPSPWDQTKWSQGLQSWHDYFDHVSTTTPLDAPAGMTVARESATSNTVSWYSVYRATSYTLQRKSLSPPGSWSSVSGCDPASTTCIDTATTGSRYAYRVQASNADGNPPSPWAQVAVFVSEGSYDGYVTGSNGTRTPVPNAAQPGIQAGQGSDSDVSGFVSFDTSAFGSSVTALNGKLRLKQYTSNACFEALGACIVDIRRGRFNNNVALEGADFDATETDVDVTPDVQLTGVDSGNWVEAELHPDYISDINTLDRTQFRIWFGHVQGAGEQLVGWHSGESTGNEPHLVVQYTEP